MAVDSFSSEQKLSLANGLTAMRSARSMSANSLVEVGTRLSVPLLCLLAACGTVAGSSKDSSAAAPAASKASIGAATIDPAAFKVGTNLNTIFYWDGSRAFNNLIYGGGWQMQASAGTEDVPATSFDANGWIKSLPAGYHAFRVISIPAASADIVCNYQGNGLLSVGGPVSNVVQTAGKTTFHYNSSYPTAQWAWITFDVDPSNYIRNIDCREAGATTTSSFAPEFSNTLAGFKVIRFMKWQSDAVENNAGIKDTAFPTPTITWATRNKPGDGDYSKRDGVPVELEVELANQIGADPFFSMPWNADDDYITQFATYVRDHLAPGRQAYVETSNEVWNWGYPVTYQAVAEGRAEGLPGDSDFQVATERYGEKTAHVMQIWSNVFSGQMSRLVRVYSFQNVQPYYGEMGLKYAVPYVDAYATAPYWQFMQSDYTGQSLDQIMNTVLPAKITETLGYAAQNKALAQKYALRYITYEAGQHVVLPNNLDLLTQIERDPRMGDLYKSYISQWQTQIGDTLTLFALTGPISRYGAWGMAEYAGQPLTQAPKLNAVEAFLGLSTATSTTTTTQVCPDGSVIPVTSTCQTPTTSTPSGKRRGTSKKGTAIA